jgi:hypothetical protein
VQVNDIDDYVNHISEGHFKDSAKKEVFTKKKSIGIETVGFMPVLGDDKLYEPLTQEQINADRKLVGCLMGKYNIDFTHIQYHGFLSSNKRPLEGFLVYKAVQGVQANGNFGNFGTSVSGSGQTSGSTGGSGSSSSGGGASGAIAGSADPEVIAQVKDVTYHERIEPPYPGGNNGGDAVAKARKEWE